MPAAGARGKPVAPVDLSYEILGELDAGRSTEIRLTVTPRRDGDAVTLVISGISELELTERTIEFPTAVAGEPRTTSVVVRPSHEGEMILAVTGTLAGGTDSNSRSFSIPIPVGNTEAVARSAIEPSKPRADQIESLPATETVRKSD